VSNFDAFLKENTNGTDISAGTVHAEKESKTYKELQDPGR